MSSYKKILIAVDLATDNKKVLSKAANMVATYNAEVVLLSVCDLPPSAYGNIYIAEIYALSNYSFSEDDVRKKMIPQLQELATEFGLPAGCIAVEFGRPSDVIVETAEQENADLIVLGSHGKHGLGLLLGSTASGVLHHAKCDVTAVRIHKEDS